jgi:hypothetical protein
MAGNMNESGFYTPEQDLEGKWEHRERAGLPRVLLLGDSISIGYTPFVVSMLAGIANVSRPTKGGRPINWGSTDFGVASLGQQLGDGRWDVIHFNWGLHDIAYRNPESQEQGHRDKINGTLSTEPDRYKSNLEQIVALLKRAGTKLIWASTTVVPPNEAGRFEGDEVKYNEIAKEIMEDNGVLINDLYNVSRQFGPEMFTAPGNVHFTKEGYEKLAAQVASTIQSALAGHAG